jgi:hypothetical protein
MNKIATLLTAALIAGFVAVKMSDDPSLKRSPWMDEQKLQERLRNYQCFKQTLNEALDSLEKGEISLKEAHARVFAAARRFQPEYLEHLSKIEPGTTDDERVARNLVGHLQMAEDLQERSRALKIELRAIHDD